MSLPGRTTRWQIIDRQAETSPAFIALVELLHARRDRATTPGGGGQGGRTVTVTTSADGASHLATVVAIESATRARVDVEGTILPATVPPDQDKVLVGDTVQVGHQAGVWTVTSIITKHDPPPQPAPEPMIQPSRPSISVSVSTPSTPTGSQGYVGSGMSPNWAGMGLPIGNQGWASPSNIIQQRIDSLVGVVQQIVGYINALATQQGNSKEIDDAHRTAIGQLATAVQNLATGINGGFSTATTYTQNVGNSAGAAIDSGAGGGGIKVQPFSLTAMPENIDRDGYATDNDATRTQIMRILNWRIRAILDLRAGVNRARKHQGLAELAAFPAAPDPVVDDVDWGTAAGMIQAVDDWASTRMLALVAAINEIRARESLGRGTYSSGRTYAWSGGTYQAARPTLIVSMRNYRVWLEEAGTALKEPVGIINSQVPASSPQPQPATPQKRIIGISLSGMPDNIDKDAYASWSEETRFQVTRILAWRTRTILDLHAAVNRARAYYSLTPMPARPAAPDVIVDDDLSFSTAATKIQAVDDWASNALNAIITGINQVRAQAGKGPGAWSGGVLAWSGSTYPTARASLIVSMRNYRIRCSESGTALMDVVNAVNNG
ncbi:hypothetical protein [Salana multivorans]